MRVAVMIIALCLAMILGVQSCAITAGGALLSDAGTKGAGSTGLLLAVIFVVGAAFTWGFPRFAGALFLAGGVLALLASAGTPFCRSGDLGLHLDRACRHGVPRGAGGASPHTPADTVSAAGSVD